MPKQFAINAKQFANNAKAVHQQRKKQFTSNAKSTSLAMLEAAVCSQQSATKFLSEHYSVAWPYTPATCNRQSLPKSPTPELIRTLNAEALWLHLDRHNLVRNNR